MIYQRIAFAQGGLYLLTALFGLGTICRYTCMIAFFLMACILSAFASLGALGCYCYLIYIFVVFGSFENCQEACLYHTVPVCVLALLSIMAFISALVGSIYCFIGTSSSPPPSTSNKYTMTAERGNEGSRFERAIDAPSASSMVELQDGPSQSSKRFLCKNWFAIDRRIPSPDD
eukprot:XP_011663091.1 PREDICTED: uncharacterized protein LOC100891468 [Strongylocentrotus purpuratus]